MKTLILLTFQRLKQGDLVTFANNVYQKMLVGKQYDPLRKDVELLKQNTNSYEAALAASIDGGKALTAAKKAAMTIVLNQLSVIASGVDALAKGDEVFILNAGFAVRAMPTRVEILLPPTDFMAQKSTIIGWVALKWKPVIGAKGYTVEKRVKSDENPLWETAVFSTSVSTNIKNLPLETYVEFRVRAVGTKDLMSDWSPTIGAAIS